MGKIKVRLSEQDLTQLLARHLLGGEGEDIIGAMLKDIQGDKSTDKSEKDSDSNIPAKKAEATAGEFMQLDLNNPSDYKAYEDIANRFISGRSSNLLGIRGSMLADAAKKAQNMHGKYVPVELALGQLAAEGGFSKDPKSRPIRTKNPYNVGNTDSGANVQHGSVQSGIDTYYSLIARNYLTGGKTASDLLDNFVNKNGHRYASGKKYEQMVSKIASDVQRMAQPVYASLNKKKDSDIA